MNYEERLIEIAQNRPEVMVMTAENRAALRSVPARLGPRFIDVGIAEQTLVGMAAGLASRGRIPVVHALAPFLTMRAFEFIRTDVALGRLPVKLVGFIPGLLSDGNGPTHQSLEDIALMRVIPKMKIFCPADQNELVDGLSEVIETPGPCYVRFNASAPVKEHASAPAVGTAERIGDTRDVAILCAGVLVREALGARKILVDRGIQAGVINLRWLVPVDEFAIVEAAQTARLLVTVEDHFLVGGVSSLVSEILVRRCLSTRLVPLAFDGRWFVARTFDKVLESEGLSPPRLAARIAVALNEQRGRYAELR